MEYTLENNLKKADLHYFSYKQMVCCSHECQKGYIPLLIHGEGYIKRIGASGSYIADITMDSMFLLGSLLPVGASRDI